MVFAAEAGTSVLGTRVTFAVHNLFNQSYLEPMSFIAEAGRTYALSIRRDVQLPLGRH